MRRRAVLLASLVAGGCALFFSLPPRPQELAAPSVSGVRGVMHVHTRVSDGSGTAEQVATAAARAGLQFVILSDHGDGTRTPARPAYHSGVLVVDAVEISTEEGHVVALGLQKAPYPLRGEPRDIVEDVARLGAMSIVAHPGSAKPQLRWTDWVSPFNGMEWLNADSESRDEKWSNLARALFTYPIRPAESLATMLDRPDTVLRRWDALTARRRVVAVAGADAHARLDVSGNDSGNEWGVLRIPGYRSMFRAFSVTAAGVRFTRNPEVDRTALLDAISKGHLYSSIDAVAGPAAASFTATRGSATWTAGDLVPPGDADIELRVEHNGPPASSIVLIKDGKEAATTAGRTLRQTVAGARAVYRVEIRVPGAPGDPPVPWIVMNPIYIRAQDETPLPRGDATETAPQYENGDAPGWRIEKSPRSRAALDVVRSMGGTELLLRWAIGGMTSESPYAAFVMPAGTAAAAHDRLLFTSRADRPMRLSVQFRLASGERWRRSVYLDETPRQIAVFFDDVRPVSATSPRLLPVDQVRDVLFVVDTVNAPPGSSGQFWIDDVKYAR